MEPPSLLLGWPLEPPAPAGRPFAASRRTNRFADGKGATTYARDGHLLTFAPTGAGKGVRVIIPNLLHYSGPVITVDPKGENFAVTARYRKEVLGQRIFLLDPFEAVAQETLDRVGVERGTLNPLDLVAGFKGHIEPQLTMLASMLAAGAETASGGTREDSFWSLEAQKLAAGVLGAVVQQAQAENRPISFQAFVDQLFGDDTHWDMQVLLDSFKGLNRFSRQAISAWVAKPEKERGGVLSTAQSYLTPFLSSEINRHLDSSTIRPQMIHGDDDYTVYIVIPPSKLTSHALLLRLWIATLLNAVMEREQKPMRRTLFLLDECAQLGELDVLKKAVTLLRGYGLQVWMFFQDFAQLEKLYETDHATIVNNCEVLQVFGLSRLYATRPMSRVIGGFSAADLVKLDKSQQALSISTEPTKLMRLMNYLDDPIFEGRFDRNPLFVGQEKTRRPATPFPSNALRIQV